MTGLRRTALVGVAAALVALATIAAAQPLFAPTQDPLAGSRVFGDKGCVRCHAVNGAGGNLGPDLGRLPRPRSFFELGAGMWNHLPRMAERMRQLGIPRPHLDARESGDLIAFLFTVNYFDPPGLPAAGRRLFVAKKCVVCHQVGDVGGVVGPNLDFLKQYASPIFVAAALWNHGPAMAEIMQAKKIERSTFKDTELVDLLAYIRSTSRLPVTGPLHVLPGRAEEGGRLFAEKRCRDCHGAAGKDAAGGPDLAERVVHQSLTQFAAAMWNKAPAMLAAMKARGIAVPQLRADEMADIVAYLYDVQYFGQPQSVQRGFRVARDKGCLGCHTVRAADGKPPIDLSHSAAAGSPAGVIAALWNHSFVQEGAAGRRPAGWAALRGDELADVVAFLRSVRQSHP